MTNSALLAVIYALCVYRLTHLVTGDALTDPTREWLRDRSHEVQVRTITERGNEKVEERLAIEPVEEEAGPLCPEDEVVKVQVLEWIEKLACEELSPADRQLVAESLKRALFRDLPEAGLPAG